MGQRLTFSYTADVTSSANPELVVLQETCRALTRLRDEAAARSLAELVVRRYQTSPEPATTRQNGRSSTFSSERSPPTPLP